MLLQGRVHPNINVGQKSLSWMLRGSPSCSNRHHALHLHTSSLEPLLHNKQLTTAAATSDEDVAAASCVTQKALHSQPCMGHPCLLHCQPIHTSPPPSTCCENHCKLDNVSQPLAGWTQCPTPQCHCGGQAVELGPQAGPPTSKPAPIASRIASCRTPSLPPNNFNSIIYRQQIRTHPDPFQAEPSPDHTPLQPTNTVRPQG